MSKAEASLFLTQKGVKPVPADERKLPFNSDP